MTAESGLTLPLYLCRLSQWAQVADTALAAILTHEEQQRLATLSHPSRARTYLLSRYLLRQLLTRELGAGIDKLDFVTEPHGRPYLPGRPLEFSLSHSGDWIAIALAERRLGVDIEQLRPLPNAQRLVKRFFSPAEQEQMANLNDSAFQQAFFSFWSLKEAVLKAHGGGLQAGLHQFDIQLDTCQLLANRLDPHTYQMDLLIHPPLVMAVAVQDSAHIHIRPQWIMPGLEIAAS